jgi:hypothetical protein
LVLCLLACVYSQLRAAQLYYHELCHTPLNEMNPAYVQPNIMLLGEILHISDRCRFLRRHHELCRTPLNELTVVAFYDVTMNSVTHR